MSGLLRKFLRGAGEAGAEIANDNLTERALKAREARLAETSLNQAKQLQQLKTSHAVTADVNGRKRYAGSGALVFPNVAQEAKPSDSANKFTEAVQLGADPTQARDSIYGIKPADISANRQTFEDLTTLGMPKQEALKTAFSLDKGGDQSLKFGTKLRTEFNNLTSSFRNVRDAHSRVLASAKDPSAAGDLALIFNYMKVLDPGSVVRESEFATAENSGGVPAKVRNMYNKVITGERLPVSIRTDFVKRSTALYHSQESSFNQTSKIYSGLAERYGTNPENVALDYRLPQQAQPVAQAPSRTDLEYTAKAHGITVEEVVNRLRASGQM